MADNFRFAQLQPFVLAGAGVVIGDTSITLSSMTDIAGNALTMATDFGSIGYGTLEPGTSTQEEQISFTGLTNNSNGTTTLTGVSTVGFLYPYTEASGLAKTHPGGSQFVISNTSGFYNKLTSKSDDETILGTWTFTSPNYPRMDTAVVAPVDNEQLATKKYVDDTAIAGSPKATNTVFGISKLSLAAASAPTPIVVGDNDPRVPTQSENDALVGTSGTPSSANKFVTNDDTATAATASKVARRLVGGNLTVVTEAQANNSTNAASTAYVDAGLAALPTYAWQKVSTQTTSAVSLTSGTLTKIAEWTGLTGNTDDEYYIELEYEADGTVGSAALLALRLNTDSTAGHYGWNNIIINTTTIGTSQDSSSTELRIAGAAGNSLRSMFGDVKIKASTTISGTGRATLSNINGNSSAGTAFVNERGAGGWTDTSNQLTSVQIYYSQNSGSTRTITGKATLYKLIR